MADVPMLIDRGFVRLAEGLMHYRLAGPDGGGTPLVMLHASPASSQTLEPLARALAGGRRVLMPDTPGNGASCPPAMAEPDLPAYADMIDRFCDTLGLAQVDVYGTHTGAHIAIEWAIAHPARIGRLVLDGVAILSADQRDEFLEHYAPPRAPDAAGTQFPWAWNMIRDQMIFWPHYRQDAAHLRQGGQFEPRLLHDLTLDLLNALDTYHQPYRAVFRHDPVARLAQVAQRTLWLQSSHGPLDTDSARAFAALPSATAVAVTDVATRASAIAGFLD
jgi:pimeloyl-ACP methyl ester carboxylesterase